LNKIARLAMAGIASVGLVATMNSAATAAPTAASVVAGPAGAQDWGGGWSDVRDVTIREKPSTTSRKIGTLKKGKIVKCWVAGCSAVDGGNYKCTSNSPTENRWHEVNWGGKKRYAATRCLEWGRVE
jgi:hypothetical protein